MGIENIKKKYYKFKIIAFLTVLRFQNPENLRN